MESMGMTSFWSGKKVFVTGHTGFKGGWLSIWLQMLGADVTGYALQAPTNPSIFETARVATGMHSIIGDIRDLACLQQAISDSKPEIILHLAAQPLVRYSYANPVETYATNVMGSVHLLESVRNCSSVRAVVMVTSDKCYENREWLWGYRENEAMGGYDPYSNSKGCAELVTSAYRQSFFNPEQYDQHGIAIASARAGNVIGGGDWANDRLIPDILKTLDTGHEVLIRSPHAIRPWQHVLEPLAGYLMLAEKLYTEGVHFAEAWNFGPDDQDMCSVGALVKQLQPLFGDRLDIALAQTPPALHEAGLLRLDSTKARTQLGWRPRWRMKEAVQQIHGWHTAWLAGNDMRTVTEAQIQAYMTGNT
ncbi:CDP-glucose 4,6-dehydratase [Leeia oryzae]|uniref:CDP-glucose 4,6-dehydratase n=1 Tax=Leeia oryzae TaxID=356662 RepID=UPI001FE2375D|nr:CDP-glucose 4,6-dehydratase [Leeia oryzae]